MKKLATLILALSGMAAFAVAAADSHTSPVLIQTAATATPSMQPQSSVRRILMPASQSVSCKRATWPYIPDECLERVPASQI
ncbi:hypothetical protein DFR52_102313 [Hoeflea marina]|uniref:Porin n=1 Tax=Hoeflea marina TaxID=274592 RepID=A0A317PPZ6_9HYPH|nr:hypothetical protein [Hoeflea marina]PWW01650.1 hypothetical protein DFR52_102313 [Hoeflea marina]